MFLWQVTHWQHPRFHAYFPAGNSYPSILGDMLGDAIGCVGFSWAASPACTELETIVLDWLGKMINLPDDFLSCKKGSKGGGVIQVSATYVSWRYISNIKLWHCVLRTEVSVWSVIFKILPSNQDILDTASQSVLFKILIDLVTLPLLQITL